MRRSQKIKRENPTDVWHHEVRVSWSDVEYEEPRQKRANEKREEEAKNRVCSTCAIAAMDGIDGIHAVNLQLSLRVYCGLKQTNVF